MRTGPQLLAAAILCSASALIAQGPGPIVIRTETRMVLVDAVVTDKNGSVRDLGVKDFHVWEDGREQTLQSAAFVADPKGPSQPSYLVLFFDNASMDLSAQSRARDAAVQFIESNAGPNRYMAIVNYGDGISIAQNFTTDTDRLKRVAYEQHVSADVGTSATGSRGRGASSSSTGAVTNSAGSGFATGLRLLAANLASVPGRKNVVIFSQGFPYSPQMDIQMKGAIEECNRTDVALYPILFRAAADDPSVVQAGGRRGSTRGPSLSDVSSAPSAQSLTPLAIGTGGFLYENANALLAGLIRIGKEQNEYYLLGYTPVESPEGSCHPLKVKVDRPGVTVRARANYCNVKSVDLLAGKEVEKDLEYRITGDAPGSITATMELPFFYTEPDTARLNVAMEIPGKSLQFDKVKGKFHSELNIVGIAYLANGSAAARFSDTVKLDLATQKDLDAFRAHPMHYEKECFLAPGSYTLKVGFTSGGEAFGKLETPLTIEPYDGKQFALSGLAMSKETHPASDLGSIEDAELLEGRTPLIYKDVKIVPAGANTFSKSDPLVVYGEIYEPLLGGANKPVVELRMQLVNLKTNEAVNKGAMRPEIAEHPDSPKLPFALKLKTDTLSPGSYRVDVEALDTAGKDVMRSVIFEIR